MFKYTKKKKKIELFYFNFFHLEICCNFKTLLSLKDTLCYMCKYTHKFIKSKILPSSPFPLHGNKHDPKGELKISIYIHIYIYTPIPIYHNKIHVDFSRLDYHDL